MIAESTGRKQHAILAQTVALTDGATPPEWIMWMPAGRHVIHCRKAGKPIRADLEVTPDAVPELNAALQATSSKRKPWFDFNHQSTEASGYPLEFAWRQDPEPGIYARVDWSSAGAEAIAGKVYTSFSPAFFASDSTPARITGAPLNMGGLTNDPAFREIAPLWAELADSDEPAPTAPTPTPDQVVSMSEPTNTAPALEARLMEAQQALTATQTRLETEKTALQAKLDAANAALQAQREREADQSITAAVARGAIAPKDEAAQARWKKLLVADPENQVLLANLAANPAVASAPLTAGRAVVVTDDLGKILQSYQAERDPLSRGRIYRQHLDPILAKGDQIPFDRAVYTADNTLGTLVGNIISQRTLSLVFSSRPMLRNILTDLSAEQARLNQVIYTRGIGLPTVQDFGGTITDAAVTDYPVTLGQHKQVEFAFTAAEYNATNRNLIAEHSQALAMALGNHLVDAAAALITDAFTNETVVANASVDFTTISGITRGMNIAGVPDMNRFGWVNSYVAEALRNDEIVMANYDRNNTSGYAHWRGVEGFEDIWEYPALPANSVNVTGFFAGRDALILAARIPADPASLLGAGYPGALSVITDPVTGLSVLANQYIEQGNLKIHDRLIVMYGVARGLIACGHKTVSS